jgi:hypothetical protein
MKMFKFRVNVGLRNRLLTKSRNRTKIRIVANNSAHPRWLKRSAAFVQVIDGGLVRGVGVHLSVVFRSLAVYPGCGASWGLASTLG